MQSPGVTLQNFDLLHLEIPQFRYGQQTVFHDTSIDLVLHGWTGLVGRSGVGKTTLMRCLSGLERLRTPLRTVLMTQNDQLLPWKTVLDNVVIPALMQQQKPNYDWAQQLLVMLGLRGTEASLPHQLSTGMRQRVALARTLYQEADLILLDEPFGALDALTREQLYPLIVTALQGKTVLMVSHDPQEVMRLSDRIYLMSGKPAHLYHLDYPINGAIPRALNHPFVSRYAVDLVNQLEGSW
ncbi:ABC transporter ATP-binding protein [Candidatus Odyssella acanthamoebae]|uniref:ABC transporter ATP-binding protein n=1 Tax=Candidatus Odyssella acanthamoebae TaxID=91604 RepID=UPI00068CDD3A|nr:ABC transporter ATP-binding protein [Candidatus Paracaedibacter acanthamoebae]